MAGCRDSKNGIPLFLSVCGEAGDVDMAETEDWRSSRLKDLLKDYSPKDIFNADETGLFYKMRPNKTLAFKKETVVGGKKSKERLTVMVCSNMDGSQKLPLLVIGKFKNPRCFKGLKQLPVEYDFNRKAWITQIVFENWLRKLDRKFAMQKRKVLMFVDNCSAHGDIEDLSAIKLEFLPPNTTSVLQPMDQGIIQNLKVHYRRKLLQRVLFCMDHKIPFEMDVLKGIHYLAAAWTAVSSETINNCFMHAGFHSAYYGLVQATVPDQVHVGELQDISSDILALRAQGLDIPEGVNAETYIHGDDHVPVCEQLDDDEIVRQVTSTETCPDSDEDDESANKVQPSQLAVYSAIETLQLYFSMQGDSVEELNNLSKMEVKALVNSKKQLKQGTLDSFLI